MAPARRKRAAAAAAAAAAQWKVGDLVLAKMKGFPAWPAVISEPEQWGYSSVKKKLLVYFYGTKQIAFCNYSDLEAFTEEKKKSLLVKRHGKGADFVRAVKEIVEIYDSLKKEDNNKSGLTGRDVRSDVENLANNSGSLDTGGPGEGSDLVNDNKLEDRPASSMDYSMVSTPGSNIVAMVSEHCVVNSASDEPASSFSKKRQNDAQQPDSCTHGNLASPRRLRNSLGAELRTHDSCGLTNDTNLSSVDLIPDDKQEDSSWYKCIGNDKPNSDSHSATKDVVLLRSSRGTCSQSGTSGISNDDKNPSSTDNIQSTRNIEVSQTQTGVMDKDVNLNGTYDLSMSATVTFKRKRKPNTNCVNDPVAPNMDEELQPKSSGNLADSPNSGNEVNKSDGDEHLPLVKRARVRMGRPLPEDSVVDEPDISDNKTELATHANQCYKHDLSTISEKDHSADGVSPGIDPSPKVDRSVPSGEVQTACKNKEYQPRVLTLDGEAALPPSKRLHRALEAMSANAAETISNPPEVKKSKELILNCCTASIASFRSNNSAFALVKSPRSAIAKSPKISSSAHSLDTPTGQKHISRPIILDKDSPSTISLELKNDGSHNPPNYKVCTRIDNDVCEKAPTYSVESKEPALVPMLDQLSLGKESGNEFMEPIGSSAHDFGKNIDESAEPVSQAKAVTSGNNRNCNSVPHDKAVLAEPTDNVGDRTSSSLVTKASCIQSDAGTRTYEAHGSSGIALKELDHRINPKDRSLSPDLMPMKELIAAAHARRFSQPTSFIDSFLDSNVISESLANIPSLKEGSGGRCSPSNHTIRSASDRTHTQQNSGKIPSDNMQQKSLNKLAGHDEASSARRTFEAFLGTLTRTKESITRATRLALECAKHSIAGEVMDIIIERLEKESNLYKRVDVFFLVNSIIQCCRNQKGGVGDVYPSLIQAVLPRILYASAPPGNSAWENRRQCLKVLKLWLERKTLSEYIIRHHIKELETLNEASFGSSRRPSGTERALNDPLRDNEGMLVDEYGSNTGFHLPNLICTKILDEQGGSSPQRSFEAVTPEHEATGANEQEASQLHAAKHRLVLEEVNGDLEMEDVAPSSEAEARSACQPDLTDARCTTTNQNLDSVPPLPEDKPPSPPPLPSSPPPLPRPHSPVFQGSHVQGALHVAADRVEPEPPRATYNVQDQHPHSVANNRGNMDPCVVPSHPPAPYTSGYAGHTNQILPPPPAAPFHPPGPHGNYSGPPVPHHGNNYHQPPSAPLPNNNAYHLQPPPHPPVPNQFPYIPPEPQQRTQPWNCNSSYPERYQFSGHDRGHHAYDRRHHFDDRGHHFDDGGHHFDDRRHHFDDRGHHFDDGGHRFDDGGHRFDDGGHRFDDGGHRFDDGAYHFDDRGHHFDDRGHHFSDTAVRGQMHLEVTDRGRFPPHFPPGGPPFPDHFEASSTPLHCGRPLDPPPGPCPEWSMPPRRSKYPPASRHSMEPPVSHGGGWRRHGRHNYDRYHR